MGFSKEKREKIKKNMLEAICSGMNPYQTALEVFNVSRQTLNTYLKSLKEENLIIEEGGSTRKTYKLKENSISKIYSINEEIEEEIIFTQEIEPLIINLPENIKDIIHYTSTEIINNAIDHSNAKKLKLFISENAFELRIYIMDNGIGIFKKIMEDHNLKSEDEAIFQLTKGKLTSDQQNHSGEGIFFSSRATDFFSIYSGKKVFHSIQSKDMLEEHNIEPLTKKGTLVAMLYKKNSEKDITNIFKKYQDEDCDFSRTEVKIKLAEAFSKTLMSRSVGKRVVTGFSSFKDIVLDFKDVRIIGQGFADQIFRVFKEQNPHKKIRAINTNENIKIIINHVNKKKV